MIGQHTKVWIFIRKLIIINHNMKSRKIDQYKLSQDYIKTTSFNYHKITLNKHAFKLHMETHLHKFDIRDIWLSKNHITSCLFNLELKISPCCQIIVSIVDGKEACWSGD